MARAAQICAAFVFAFMVLSVTAVPMVRAQSSAKFKRDSLSLMMAGGDKKIDIEVAETLDQKSLGLMFRTSLADNQGMLFPYERPQELTMWMKNTYISLDMVFIRADGIVHRIAVRTEPLSEKIVASEGDVVAVLELAGGAAERLGLKAGDRIAYPLFGKKP
jgi:uncharacterized protein